MEVQHAVARRLRFSWLLILAVGAALPSLGARFGMHREDLQTIVFPLVLVAFVLGVRDERWRLPRSLILLTATFWLFGALNARNFLPTSATSDGIAVTRLSSDPRDINGHELKRRTSEIARHFGLFESEDVPLTLASDQEAVQWLRRNERVSILVRGDADRLRLVLPPARNFFDEQVDRTQLGSESFLSTMHSVGLAEGEGISLVDVPSLSSPLVVVALPTAIPIAAEPKELVRHFLVWLAPGLASDNQLLKLFSFRFEANTELKKQWVLALRKHFFQVASDLYGAWESNGPRALAIFLRGNMYLADAIVSDATHRGNYDSGSLDCALGFFDRAINIVQKEYAQEIYAAVLNNTAVACVLHQARPPACALAYRGLIEASKQTNAQGELVRGARAAYLNLMLVKRDGLF